jgi:hypothetical protein
MRPAALALLALALLALSIDLRAEEPTPEMQRADRSIEEIGNVDLFLDEVENAVYLAGEGGYGSLRRGDMQRLKEARDVIVRHLDGKRDARALPPEERLAVFNAQEAITAIIRNDDKNRLVCRKLTSTGSRVPKTECLTVAERERMARNSQNLTSDVLRMDCVPGEGNPCAK